MQLLQQQPELKGKPVGIIPLDIPTHTSWFPPPGVSTGLGNVDCNAMAAEMKDRIDQQVVGKDELKAMMVVLIGRRCRSVWKAGAAFGLQNCCRIDNFLAGSRAGLCTALSDSVAAMDQSESCSSSIWLSPTCHLLLGLPDWTNVGVFEQAVAAAGAAVWLQVHPPAPMSAG